MPITLQPTIFKYKNSNGVFQSATCISGEAVEKTISGTTPTIVAESNTKYKCGEVSILNFTPCTYGMCEVIFTSGSTPTVLTLPNTVKMPQWFDIDVNRIYDIIITDGVYGAVTSWAV